MACLAWKSPYSSRRLLYTILSGEFWYFMFTPLVAASSTRPPKPATLPLMVMMGQMTRPAKRSLSPCLSVLKASPVPTLLLMSWGSGVLMRYRSWKPALSASCANDVVRESGQYPTWNFSMTSSRKPRPLRYVMPMLRPSSVSRSCLINHLRAHSLRMNMLSRSSPLRRSSSVSCFSLISMLYLRARYRRASG